MSARVEVLPGRGSVIRYGELTIWAGGGVSAELISFLQQSARNVATSASSGRLVVDHITGILATRDPERNAPFAVIGPTETGWIALLHGPVQAWDGSRWLAPTPEPGWLQAAVEPRPAVSVGPAGGPSPRLVIASPYDLVAGMVPGGGVIVLPGAGQGMPPSGPDQAAATDAPGAARPAAGFAAASGAGGFAPAGGYPPADGGAPAGGFAPAGGYPPADGGAPAGGFAPAGGYPPAGGAVPPGGFPPAGGAVPAGEAAGSWGASAPGSGPPGPPRPAPIAGGQGPSAPGGGPQGSPLPGPGGGLPGLLTPAGGASPASAAGNVQAPPSRGAISPPAGPSRIAGRPGPVQPGPIPPIVDLRHDRSPLRPPLPAGFLPPPPDRPEVGGIRCPRGHFNRPGMALCAYCRVPIPPGQPQVPGKRPTLGVLLADDGTVYRVARDLLIGANPAVDTAVAGGTLQPLVLASAPGLLAPAHTELRLHGWMLRAVDRGSASGTFSVATGAADWVRLEPYTPVDITPGSHLSLGQRVLTYLSPWR